MHREDLSANWELAGDREPLGGHRAAAVTELVRIADVRPLEGHWVRLWFSDGVVKDVDLGEALAGGGVFDPIYTDRQVFEQVRVNPESRTIEWPGGVDLDPDVLYGTFEPEGAFGSSGGWSRNPQGIGPGVSVGLSVGVAGIPLREGPLDESPRSTGSREAAMARTAIRLATRVDPSPR
jgi:Protein of unknown function (DUF2442)